MVIDFRARPPIPEAYPEIVELSHYGELYRGGAALTRADLERGWEVMLSQMDDADVGIAVLFAEDFETTLGKKVPNELIARGVRRYPDRFRGMASVDPHKGDRALEELEYAVRELGMVGLTLWPCFSRLYCTDPKYYRLYEKCLELGVFVVLHTSVNFSSSSPLDMGRPVYLDQVAIDFPELTIVASHAGWPWVLELIAVAWRHPNVMLETSAMRPKYMMREHSGWGPLFNYSSVLADRVMFGTAWPLLPFKRSIDEFRRFPIDDAIKEKWLHGNAARLLGLNE